MRYSDEQMIGAVEVDVDEDGSGYYAVIDKLRSEKPVRYQIDHKERVVHIEGATRQMKVQEFFEHTVRVDEDNRAICSFLEALHKQYELCKGRSGGYQHQRDIADYAEHVRASPESDADRIDVGMFDIVSSGIDDGLTFMEILAKVTAKSGRPIHETSGLAEAIPGPWAEIRNYPQYMVSQIRAFFGTYMDDKIGDFPLERISRLHAAPGFPLAMHLEGIADLISDDEPFQGGNILPGYKTSRVAHYRGDGFDAIVFSDPMGTYAYSWGTPEGLDRTPNIGPKA